MKTAFVLLFGAALFFSCSTDDGSGGSSNSQDNADVVEGETGGGTGDASTATEETTDDYCRYPEYSGALRLGQTMPPFNWTGAYNADGSTADLNFYELYCGTDGRDFTSIVFVVGAGWCPNCPDYIRYVNDMATQLEANNALIVFMETQDANYQLSSSAQSDEYLTRLIGRDHGMRVGDLETDPTSGAFTNSPDIVAVPTAFVVRTSDMGIIADQSADDYLLDFSTITSDPANGWTGGSTAEPNCTAEQDEEFEPNDTVEQAATIMAGTIEGGVCNFEPDFYKIAIEGEWQLDLAFSNSVGDLDVYVWDTAVNQPVSEEGRFVGSDSTNDNESFTYQGVVHVMIHGYQRATSPYTLTLTEL